MPLTLKPRQDHDTTSLLERLERLRGRYRRSVVLGACSQWLCVLLLSIGLGVYLDYRYPLPALIRALLLVAILGFSGIFYFRRLARPLRARGGLLAMALRVEEKFPQLNDSLASAVQFLQMTEAGNEYSSSYLRQETIDHAGEACQDLDFNAVVSTKGARRWLCAALVLVAPSIYALNAAPQSAAIGLQRLAEPFSSLAWPHKTQLEILAPRPIPPRLARGDALELKVAVRGVIPERLKLLLTLEGGSLQELAYSLPRPEPESKESILQLRIEGSKLPRSFRFRLKANDAETSWCSVAVQPAPALVPLEGRPSPQIKLDFPAYTDLPPLELSDGTSVIEAVSGTVVTLRAATDRPIVRAWLSYQPENTRLLTASALAPLGIAQGLGAACSLRLAEETAADIPFGIDAEGRTMEASFIPRLPGAYLLRFEDDSGLAGTRLFDFRIQPDPAPFVTLQRPAALRESLAVLPDAEITLEALAVDRVFALKDVFIEYRTARTGAMRRLDLFDSDRLGQLLPKLALLMPGPIHGPPDSAKYISYSIQQKMPMQRFSQPTGLPLKEGDVLILRVAASDFDTVNPIKAPGRSHEVELQIVGRSHLEALVQQGLANIRNEILQLREFQQEARLKVQEAMKQQARSGQLRPEDLEKLLQAEQLQQQIRARLQSAEDGLIAEAARLKQTVKDNQLARSRSTERIDTVASELARLENEELDPIEQGLGDARKPAPKEKSPLARAERGQKEVEDTFKSLLERLEPWSAAGEVRGEGRSILSELARQAELTQQLKNQQKPGVSGMKREQLSADEQAELDRAAIRPDRLGDRTRQLVEKIERMIADKQKNLDEQLDLLAKKKAEAAKRETEANLQKPDSKERQTALKQADELKEQAEDLQNQAESSKMEIDALRKSIEQSDSQALKQQLQGVGEQIRQNRLENAAQNLQGSAENLQKLVDALEEKSPLSNEPQLQKKRAEVEKGLDKLLDKQDLLQKKIQAARQMENPVEREQALQKLARDQADLQRETEELAQKLSRAQADEPAQELRRAARQMEQARRQLEQGEAPERAVDDALDRLEDAQDNLDQAREREENELLREKLLKAGESIKAIRDRQQTAIEETARLRQGVKKGAGWANEKTGAILRTNLNNLLQQEEGLAKELEGLIEKRFRNGSVFERMLKQSTEAMTQAAQRLKQRRESALDQVDAITMYDDELETQSFEGIAAKQQLALKRLDQLIEALKPDRAAARPQQAQKPAEQNPMPMQGKNRESDDAPPLAQLKALRSLQADLEERTAEFERLHPDLTKLTDDDLADLESLRQAQLDVAKLIQELTPNAPPGEKP